MPLYKKSTDILIEKEDVDALCKKATDPQQPILITLLYLVGPRPKEMTLIKKDHFSIHSNVMQITVPRSKGGFERTIEYGKDSLFMDIIIPYIEGLNRESLFTFKTSERVKQIVYKLSVNRLMPYNFRHSRSMKLARLGANSYELMLFRGTRDADSVIPYVMHSGLISEIDPRLKDRWLLETPTFLRRRLIG